MTVNCRNDLQTVIGKLCTRTYGVWRRLSRCRFHSNASDILAVLSLLRKCYNGNFIIFVYISDKTEILIINKALFVLLRGDDLFLVVFIGYRAVFAVNRHISFGSPYLFIKFLIFDNASDKRLVDIILYTLNSKCRYNIVICDVLTSVLSRVYRYICY